MSLENPVDDLFVVVVPALVIVPVQVDPVADRDLLVAVVVAEVLPPQALDVERVLVAVGVGDRHEPELARVEELLHDRVLAVVVDVATKEAPCWLVAIHSRAWIVPM